MQIHYRIWEIVVLFLMFCVVLVALAWILLTLFNLEAYALREEGVLPDYVKREIVHSLIFIVIASVVAALVWRGNVWQFAFMGSLPVAILAMPSFLTFIFSRKVEQLEWPLYWLVYFIFLAVINIGAIKFRKVFWQ
jgi:hypothetical protein